MTDREMEKYDAKCTACGDAHIITVGPNHECSDVVGYAHNTGRKACGEYDDHILLRRLDGLMQSLDGENV